MKPLKQSIYMKTIILVHDLFREYVIRLKAYPVPLATGKYYLSSSYVNKLLKYTYKALLHLATWAMWTRMISLTVMRDGNNSALMQ